MTIANFHKNGKEILWSDRLRTKNRTTAWAKVTKHVLMKEIDG